MGHPSCVAFHGILCDIPFKLQAVKCRNFVCSDLSFKEKLLAFNFEGVSAEVQPAYQSSAF